MVRECSDRPDWPAFVDGLACRCEIERDKNDITIRVSFHGTLVFQCGRCLEQFQWPVQGMTVVRLAHISTLSPGIDREAQGIDFTFDDAETDVDICPALYDEVMVGLPLKPLCADTCPGIGWIQTPAVDRIDPRWDALRTLAKRRLT